MPSLRSLLLFSLPIASICATNNPRKRNVDSMSFKDIVNSLPEESVRSALHNHLAPKYRDGVFEHGKEAIEAVHHDNPALATKLVDHAMKEESEKHDLRKRQNGTEPSSTPVVPSSSTVVVEPSSTPDNGGGQSSEPPDNGGQSSTQDSGPGPGPTTKDNGGTTKAGNTGGGQPAQTQTGVLVPVTVKTTDEFGNTVEKTTSAFQESADTSTVVDVTTTNAQGQEITTQQTVPAALVTKTNARGETITSASPLQTVKVHQGTIVNDDGNTDSYTTTDSFGNSIVLSGTSAGQVITTTDASGRTVVMTYHPGGGEVSELVVKTTQLPGGGQSTITSFANVGGPTNGPEETEGRPGLQSGVAPCTAWYVGELAALVGGAVGVAAVLL